MHYIGGAMLSDNLAEAGTMFAYATCPPDPAVVGERWREMWHERLENTRAPGSWSGCVTRTGTTTGVMSV